MITLDLKKGSADFLILSLLRQEPRHGYELCKLIESRSGGVVQFQVPSLFSGAESSTLGTPRWP